MPSKPWKTLDKGSGTTRTNLSILKQRRICKGYNGYPNDNHIIWTNIVRRCQGINHSITRRHRVDELKFKYTISAIDKFGCGALIGEGETLADTMVEVRVDISPKTSPELDMKKLKGTPTLG